MNFRISFPLILLLLSCDDIGRGYRWQDESSSSFSRIYGTVGYDYGWSASYSPFDKGIIITGQRSPSIAGRSDLWAIKTNERGIMEWEKTFGGDANDVGYDVIATSDGGYLFVGHSWSFGNQQEMYVIKTDTHGNKQWEKTYGGSGWDVANSVIELKGGNFLIAGYSNSPKFSSGNTDVFIVRIDSYGEIIWQKSFGSKAFPYHEWAYDIIQIPDNGFIVVGARDRYSSGSKNGLIIRFDSDGNLVWEKELLGEGQSSEIFYSIAHSIEGYYYLCSSVNSIEFPEIYKPRITKIDGSGNIEWQRTINSNSRQNHQFRATTTSIGDVVLVGTSMNEYSSVIIEDAFMTKIDSKGNIIWSYPYGSMDKDDWGWQLFETPEKNLVFVGSTKSFGASLFDIFLFSTNSEGISK